MQILFQEISEVRSEDDLVHLRTAVKSLVKEIGFSLVNQTKLMTVASELGRNLLIHGLGGTVKIESVIEGLRSGVRFIFADTGPGIADLDLAMTDGFTSKNGMGLGLGGSKRLVDEFFVDTRPGAGTTVSVVKWL